MDNCRIGSAWHDWQLAGVEWRKQNESLDAKDAASTFGNVDGYPDIGKDARRRAFLEGANS